MPSSIMGKLRYHLNFHSSCVNDYNSFTLILIELLFYHFPSFLSSSSYSHFPLDTSQIDNLFVLYIYVCIQYIHTYIYIICIHKYKSKTDVK